MQLGQIWMDQKLTKAMADQAQNLQQLRLVHLGAVGKSFYMGSFINRYLKCENLEEFGWTIIENNYKVDLSNMISNCPKFNRLYLNMQRVDIRTIHLSALLQISVAFCDRIRSLHIKQKRAKVLYEQGFMLNSRITHFKVDSECQYNWYEKEKLSKPIISVDLNNLHIDRNYVEAFEMQLKLSRYL